MTSCSMQVDMLVACTVLEEVKDKQHVIQHISHDYSTSTDTVVASKRIPTWCASAKIEIRSAANLQSSREKKVRDLPFCLWEESMHNVIVPSLPSVCTG